jgi:phospholipase A1
MSYTNSRTVILSTIIVVISITSATAQTKGLSESPCDSKRDATERLLCFDEVAKRSGDCESILDKEKRLECYDMQSLDNRLIEARPDGQNLSVVQERYVEQPYLEESDNPWLIIPLRQTYILPYSYLFSSVNPNSYEDDIEDGIKDYEAKYQISLALPLWSNMFGSESELLFGYTQISVHQLYSFDISAPTRDINYEPELIWRTNVDKSVDDFSFDTFQISLNHQSNGQCKSLSRSWNRIIASLTFSMDSWVIQLRPWYRILEDEDTDKNPDIEDYMGNGELWSWYKYNNQTFGLMLRNNLRSENNRSTVQLDWSFPIHAKLKGYLQYFNGYGETLVDYKYRNERLGIGLMLVNIF